ncbi:hypothetical protein, partial [Rhizobium setariae]|uniref:hypothetical protein n=1 Tax=Rhizobium setariae TaxID=2801340 RepID=UPI001AEEE821
ILSNPIITRFQKIAQAIDSKQYFPSHHRHQRKIPKAAGRNAAVSPENPSLAAALPCRQLQGQPHLLPLPREKTPQTGRNGPLNLQASQIIPESVSLIRSGSASFPAFVSI